MPIWLKTDKNIVMRLFEVHWLVGVGSVGSPPGTQVAA